MSYDLLDNYFSKEEVKHLMPLAVDVRSPDYFLYLYAKNKSDWLVVVEADYFFMDEVVKDIEDSFAVEVQGWRRLKEYQHETGEGMLPPGSFRAKSVNENDEEWAHYHRIVKQEGRVKYAVLQAKPRAGIDVYSFGLTFYDAPHDTKLAR